MHGHRSALQPLGVAQRGTPARERQRRLVLELAIEPPAEGQRITDLSRALELSPISVNAAAWALIAAGLVERRGGRLFPSAATRALEELWPLAL